MKCKKIIEKRTTIEPSIERQVLKRVIVGVLLRMLLIVSFYP